MSRLTSYTSISGIEHIEIKDNEKIKFIFLLKNAISESITHYAKNMLREFYRHHKRRTTQTIKREILNPHSQWIKMFATGFLTLILPLSSTCSFAELPDDSVYHAESEWRDQNNNEITISALQGKVQVIAFVYTYCQHSCPVILSKLRNIEKKISSSDITAVQFTLVSLDPERDSPELLKRYMQEHDLDECRWVMLNGNPDDVIEFSALLGVRYRPMNNDKKDIAHSNMITVLDKQGKINYQMKGLNEGPEEAVSNILELVLSDIEGENTLSSANCPQTANN
ncbi:SCO family protein [uncultured Microbulbifer sp.]|uniref:SCO family protein n=1 Tax=uncultured Microbulbifer sp. TaxID=348147 RepID=UPI0026382590|nr:SCO family protein [uncultured Microbulbifer sp.]